MNNNGIHNNLLRAGIAEALKNDENLADEIFSALRDFGVNVDRKSIAAELQKQYEDLDFAFANLKRKFYFAKAWRRAGRIFYWLIIIVQLFYIIFLQNQLAG